MIAITGASGHLGKLVIQSLVKKIPANSIVALVRNPAKAEDLKSLGVTVRVADYDLPESWTKALEGVSKLLLISSSEVGKREIQHKAVVLAAKAANIKHIAYTSILKADSSSMMLAKEHLATESEIRKSGMAFTFLRNGWYLENHTENLAPALQYGVISGAAKNGKFSSASRADYAEAASVVLTTAGHENKVYELAGDTAFSLSELASEVARLSGKNVAYNDQSFEDYKKFLVSVGLPEGLAHMLADSDVGASRGDLQSESKDLSRLIGRATTKLSEAIQKALR